MSITQSTAGAGGGEHVLVSRTMLDRVRRRLALQTAAQSGRYGDAELCAVLSDFDAALASAPPAGQGNGDANYEMTRKVDEWLHGLCSHPNPHVRKEADAAHGHIHELAYVLVHGEPDASAPPAPTPDAGSDQIKGFAKAILHGDDDHREWLLEAADAWIARKDLPAPRGKGTSPASPPPAEDLAGQGEPVAWKLVPKVPTKQMLSGWIGRLLTDDRADTEMMKTLRWRYRNMLHEAPAPSSSDAGGCA